MKAEGEGVAEAEMVNTITNSMDMNLSKLQKRVEARQATVHGVAQSRTRLSHRTTSHEKTLESPLDSKEIKPVNPKGNQP